MAQGDVPRKREAIQLCGREGTGFMWFWKSWHTQSRKPTPRFGHTRSLSGSQQGKVPDSNPAWSPSRLGNGASLPPNLGEPFPSPVPES